MRYAEALNVIRETALSQFAEIETISVADALGRVCAEDVISQIALPPFTNSAVDGFAVPSSVTNAAQKDRPLNFKIAGALFPGEAPKTLTPAGYAWEIMTGAPVPLDCDACAKVEDTLVETSEGVTENARSFPSKTLSVSFKSPLQKNENLRFAGTDFDEGTGVVSRGERLRAEHLMALTSVGHVQLQAFRRPRVLLVSTGKELVEPGVSLKDGEIYNSTRIYLEKALASLGCEVEIGPTMSDELETFVDFMNQVLKNPPDLLITTGAVSMGSADFVRPAFEKLGAEILFHRVDIRPGRPLLFAKFNGGRKKFVAFGLPGNPISGVVGARFFIETFLRARAAQIPEKPFRARLATAFKKPNDLRCFFKAQLVIEDGTATVHLMKGQPSYMVRPLLQSSVWAVLPEDVSNLASGELVDVYPQESLPYDFSKASGVEGDFA